MENLLKVKDLTIEYHTQAGVVHAVNGVSLEIDKGETLGLVGETGAGKTTTALSIMRLISQPPGQYVGGEILFHGKDVLKMTEHELHSLRGEEISMIFQDPMTALNPVMKVEDQIAEVIKSHERLNWKEARLKAAGMLEMVGIPAIRGKDFPHQFSGGMKQRVVIAMALARSPELLLADEPTTALDVTIQAQVLELIRNLKEKLGTSMLLITHDLGVVAGSCDRVAIMYAGEIVEYGALADIFEHVAHPYAKGLFESIPDMDSKVHRLKPIPGLMPNPIDLPKGCHFCTRCPYATVRCREVHPEMTELTPGHTVRCLLYEGEESHV